MAITNQQFQINLIHEFFKAGGPNTRKTQENTDDPLRPLLQGNITTGFAINYTGDVEVQLSFVELGPGVNIFSQACFEFSCVDDDDPNNIRVHRVYDEDGLSTSIDSVSDICYTRWTPNPLAPTVYDYEFIDEKFHAQLPNAECFENSYGKKTYFVRATPSTSNAVYVADIGYLSLLGKTVVLVDRNVPFFKTGQPGVLSARSIQPVGTGIKIAIIKRVTETDVEVVQTVFGELNNTFYLPHNQLLSNRLLTAEDQAVDLENLALNLTLLTTFKRFESSANQVIYRSANFSSPLLENTVQQSAAILQALINTSDNVPQFGSIPKTIATYLRTDREYNEEADSIYTEVSVSCFDSGCFEDDCFTSFLNTSLINRSISNRALAWVVMFFSSYSVNYSDSTILRSQVIATEYLISQKDSRRLYYKGWNDPVLYDEYNLMVRDEEMELSTQVAILMALLKTFEATQDFGYLLEACELHTAIQKYYLNNNGLFNHSLDVNEPSVESVTYQLLLAEILQDYSNITEIINFFGSRLNALPIGERSNIIVMSGDRVVVGTDPVVVDPKVELGDISDNILFVPTAVDSITTPGDIFKYNYLTYSTLRLIASKLPVSYLDAMTEKYDFIYDNIVTDREEATLTFVLSNLLDNESFLELDSTRYYSAVDLHNLKFNIDKSYLALVSNIPTDYGWYEPGILNRNTNIGKMIYSFAYINASLYTRMAYLKRVSNIYEMYGNLLNQKAADFSLTRFSKETDDSLRGRILSEIVREANTKSAIERKLDLYDNPVLIKDNFISISSFEGIDDTPFQDQWGQGFLAGRTKATTNAITIVSHQPMENDVFNLLQDVKPAGTSVRVVENLTFTVGSTIEDGTGFRMTDISGGCDNIKTEDNNDILLEGDGSNICLEDEDSIITQLPPLPGPPGDPPEETEDTCDCEWLRGYITIQGVPTEVRTMRTNEDPPGTFFYDVNATNDTVEPCNLVVKTSLINDVEEYLAVVPLPFLPAPDFFPLRSISHIFAQQGGDLIIVWFDGLSQIPKVSRTDFALTTTSNLAGTIDSVIELAQYIVIISGSNLITVDKLTMVVNTISSPFSANGSDWQFLPTSDTSVRIYSGRSTDDRIYHYLFEESSPTGVTTLTDFLMVDTRRHRYFNTASGLVRYSMDNTDMEVYATPGFDELGTLESTVSSPVLAGTITDSTVRIRISNKADQVFINVVDTPTVFGATNITSKIGNLMTFKQAGSALYQLQYLDSNNALFPQIGEQIILGNHVLTKGTNDVLGLGNNTYQAFNNFVCSTDVNTLPAGYVIQSIDVDRNTADGLLVSAVDLIANTWIILSVQLVKKECN